MKKVLKSCKGSGKLNDVTSCGYFCRTLIVNCALIKNVLSLFKSLPYTKKECEVQHPKQELKCLLISTISR